MSKVESTWFVFFVSVGLLSGLTLIISFLNDARMTDGVIQFNEMYWWENLITLYFGVSVLSNVFASASHAFGNNIRWVWINVVFWPASFYYTWKVFVKAKQDDKVST